MPQTSPWLADLGRDLRFAARSLRRTPGFTCTAIASLGAGLALAAATLAVTNAYLLRAMPFPGGERLHHVMYAPPGPNEPRGMTALDWSSLDDVVEATVVSGGATYFVGEGATLQVVRGVRASPGFIAGLGVRPVLGQSFTELDFKTGSAPVALLGQELWRSRFNSDPGIVGREIRATPENQEGAPELIRIAGILPEGFWFGGNSSNRIDLLIPLRAPARAYLIKLRAGVPVRLAEERITAAAKIVGSQFPPNWTGVHLESAHTRYVREIRPVLLGINSAAVVVLLLAVTNVAVLILLRALRRQKEVAVRIALGAERRHLLRLLAAEAAILCAAALAAGLALTAIALRVLAPVIETQLGKAPPGGTAALAVDWTVTGVMAAVCLVAALALGFVPLLAPRHRALADMLRRTGLGATDGPAMRRLRTTLMTLEIAGALVLLVGGGLMVRSVVNLMRTDFGYQPERLLRARIVLPNRGYPNPAAMDQFYAKLGERFASAGAEVEIGSSFPHFYEAYTQPVESDAQRGPNASIGVSLAGSDHFKVFGIPLRGGREFGPADRLGSEPVAIVSESAARHLWPHTPAIGRRVRNPEDPNSSLGGWRTVVGVVRDVRQTYDDRDPKDIYVPYLQVPGRYASVQARSDRASPLPLTQLATVVAEMDPYIRVSGPVPVAEQDTQFVRARFVTSLLGGFAAFAAGLTLLGLYGVTAYAVQQREREIAIRVAIGATRHDVVRLFLRDGGRVLLVGIGLGLLGSLGAMKIIASQIHGVQTSDPVTLAVASALLLGTGLLATWWPLHRRSDVNLVTLLKDE